MAEGSTATLGGSVRLTASTIISHYVLPPMLAGLREAFPAVALELAPSDSAENLLMREADIAIRMFRPTQLELITRKLGQSPSSPVPTAPTSSGAARRSASSNCAAMTSSASTAQT